MSAEKSYRDYVKLHFPTVDVSKGVKALDVAKVLGLKANTLTPQGLLAIPEFNFRAAISQAIGAAEEKEAETWKDKLGQRFDEVPEAHLANHTRLAGELYDALTPLDVDAATV